MDLLVNTCLCIVSMPVCNFTECVERVLCTEDHSRIKTTEERTSMYIYMQHADDMACYRFL